MEYQKFNSRFLSLCLGAMCCPIIPVSQGYGCLPRRNYAFMSGPVSYTSTQILVLRQELECILTAVGAIQSAFTNWLLVTLEIYQLPSSVGKLCQWFVHLYLYEL